MNLDKQSKLSTKESAVMATDNQILTSIATSDEFEELPAAFNTIDMEQVHGVTIDLATSSSAITFDMLREKTTALSWAINIGKCLDSAGVENIDLENHLCVTRWLDADGIWHRTLEGDVLDAISNN